MKHDRIALGVLAALVVAAAGAAAVGFGTAGAQSAPSADRTITVSATGEADAEPDTAVVRVAVTAEGEDPGVVRDDLATGAEQLRSALEPLSVDLRTTGFSIDGNYRARENPDAPAVRGAQRFEITSVAPDRAGAVIDAAADAGAQVDNVELTLTDERRTEVRETAIENAVADARAQADTIAQASSLQVTDVATVDATRNDFRPIAFETAAAGGDGGDGAPPTTIDSGSVSVSYGVQVTYNATA